MVRTGATWRMMPHALPPWYIIYQQTQRWLAAGYFEAMVHDLRLSLSGVKGRKASPAPPFSIVGCCNRRRRAVGMAAMTAPSVAGEPISLPNLGLIEQDRCKPSPGLIPQLAEMLGISEDALYAALGLLPPDIKVLLSPASTQQALDAFWVKRKIFSTGDES